MVSVTNSLGVSTYPPVCSVLKIYSRSYRMKKPQPNLKNRIYVYPISIEVVVTQRVYTVQSVLSCGILQWSEGKKKWIRFFSNSIRFLSIFFDWRIVWLWFCYERTELIQAHVLDTLNMVVRHVKKFLAGFEKGFHPKKSGFLKNFEPDSELHPRHFLTKLKKSLSPVLKYFWDVVWCSNCHQSIPRDVRNIKHTYNIC